jgi:hypothetical protein
MSLPSPLVLLLVSSAIGAVTIGARPRRRRHHLDPEEVQRRLNDSDVHLVYDGQQRRVGAAIVLAVCLVVLAVLVWVLVRHAGGAL